MPEPTPQEQLMLEYANAFRTNPAGEYARLTDPATYAQISGALNHFGVSLAALRQQLATLTPVAPLAWNANLAAAAQAHDAAMIAADMQAHQVPGEAALGARLAAAGYAGSGGENVYAYSQSAFYGHAGFVIDWGYDTGDYDATNMLYRDFAARGDGMQDPAGHRANLMLARYTEVGIAIAAEGDAATAVGPLVITQDFGFRANYQPQVLGVVIDDRDGDRFYDVGEGLGGVTVTLTGGGRTYSTTSWASGGWQIAAAAGTYAVRFSGGALSGTIDASVTIGAQNVKLDVAAAAARMGTYGHAAANDFDRDGHSDILWQNIDGSVSTWSMPGGRVQANTFFARVDAAWNVVETFDMNGDGRADILWRRTDGAVSVWHGVAQAGGVGFQPGSYTVGTPGAAWKIAGTGDLDGDGRDDILWRNDDGAISAWRSTGTGFDPNSYYHAPVATRWRIAGLADFDGDGRADILWRSTDGAISTWRGVGTGFAENSFFDGSVGTGWHVAGLADLNGDGRDDIVWRNDGGAVSTWHATADGRFARGVYDAQVDTGWRVVQLGDFDGDGRADLLWRDAGGAISVWRSNGSGFDQNMLHDAGASPAWTVQAHEGFF